MALTLIRVTGHFEAPDGGAADGQVELQLTGELRDPATSVVISPVPVRIPLVAGVMTPTNLHATDDAGVTGSGVVKYTATVKIVDTDDAVLGPFNLPHTAPGGTFDLSSLL